MGRVFRVYLDERSYTCKYCHTHLALPANIISKTFQCRYGRAYLFESVVNVTFGEKEERMMLTGMHTVADIFCVGCCSNVGWIYVAAQELRQKYKEGKFILERFKVLGPNGSSYPIAEYLPNAGSETDTDEA